MWGLSSVRIGDPVGLPRDGEETHFAPPSLETVVVPQRPGERGAVHAALAELAEQDPLINLRQDDVRQEVFVSLYGEVQKEVIEATLALEYALAVTFRQTTTICIERPTGSGEAQVLMEALRRAGTAVYEPIHRFTLELPGDTLSTVLPVLASLRAVPLATIGKGVEGDIPAARVHQLQQALPALTRGEGVLDNAFERYEQVRGPAPARPRSDNNPLDRKEYLLRVVRRTASAQG